MTRIVGLSMIAIAGAMFVLARNGQVVHLLRIETRQWAYTMTIVGLAATGLATAHFG